MKLSSWLKREGKSYKYLAEKLGVDRTTAFKYVNGTRGIPLKRAIEIEKITKGSVSCKDLV